MAHFFRRVGAWIRRHPLATAWIAVAIGLMGAVGSLSDGEIGGAVVGFAIAGLGTAWLIRDRALKARAAAAEIAARAEAQHRLYLDGDDRGVYGDYAVPEEFRHPQKD